MQKLLKALKASETLCTAGSITEFLPQYGEMTYSFNDGLTARIAGHGNGMFQMTLDDYLDITPGTITQIITYLESI